MIDRTRAERQRRYRERRKRGLCVVPLEVSEAEIDHLVRSGLLDPLDASDPEKLATAIRSAMHEGTWMLPLPVT